MDIQKTKDYGIFKHLIGNRAINPGHVKRLIKSINESNMLAYNPIIVNQKMEIIDGQHRLEAAKIEGLDIYYVIAPAANLGDVTLLNNNLRTWSIEKWVESYIERNVPAYLELKEFKEKYDFAYMPSAYLLRGFTTAMSIVNRELKDGLFKPTHKDWAVKMAEQITQLAPYIWIQTKNRTRGHAAGFDRNIVMALATALKVIEVKTLIAKLEAQHKLIQREASRSDYLLQLEQIYNLDEKESIRLY